MTKKLFIKTYGCQMNVYDSQRMQDALAPMGYLSCDSAQEADLIMLNTCHIREKAAEKVYSEIGRLKTLKNNQERDVFIGVTGCVAQAEGDEILRRAAAVDFVIGPQNYHQLPQIIDQLDQAAQSQRQESKTEQGESEKTKSKSNKAKRLRIVQTDFPVEEKFDQLPEETQAHGPAAFLTVQEGCDKFCTFCVVPYTRGAEYSRPVEQICDEAKRLVDQGVREITLLGQNVNAYHGADAKGQARGLGELINTLSEIKGLERLRFTTSHPNDMQPDLFEAFAHQEKLMPYLHLPVQSGSDRILNLMNRKHTKESYLELIERLRSLRPDIAFSGDFIVGFPSESDQDFAQTLNVVNQVRYVQAYSFKYSVRPGTTAAQMDDQIPEELKSERLAMLQELLNAHQQAFNQSCVGTRQSLLVEKEGRQAGQLVGRSPYMQAVYIDAPKRLLGTIVQVEVLEAGANALRARVVIDEKGRSYAAA